jgi:type IV secretory pathway VirJ component
VQPQAASESSIAFGRFGTVAVYAPASPPRQVVLFVSGDGGWNLGLVDMARRLAALGVWWAGVRWVASPLAT